MATLEAGFGFTAPSYNTIVSWRVAQEDQGKAAATMAVSHFRDNGPFRPMPPVASLASLCYVRIGLCVANFIKRGALLYCLCRTCTYTLRLIR